MKCKIISTKDSSYVSRFGNISRTTIKLLTPYGEIEKQLSGTNFNTGDEVDTEIIPIHIRLESRLRKIGIDIKYASNFPWVYITKINNEVVTETFYANHGFTAFFSGMKIKGITKWSDRKEVFKLIRKYVKETR